MVTGKEKTKNGKGGGRREEIPGGLHTNADCSPQEFDSCTILPLQDHGILEENIFFLTLITCPSGAIHQPCDSFRVSECGILTHRASHNHREQVQMLLPMHSPR